MASSKGTVNVPKEEVIDNNGIGWISEVAACCSASLNFQMEHWRETGSLYLEVVHESLYIG